MAFGHIHIALILLITIYVVLDFVTCARLAPGWPLPPCFLPFLLFCRSMTRSLWLFASLDSLELRFGFAMDTTNRASELSPMALAWT